jgi:hypothetical protein
LESRVWYLKIVKNEIEEDQSTGKMFFPKMKRWKYCQIKSKAFYFFLTRKQIFFFHQILFLITLDINQKIHLL